MTDFLEQVVASRRTYVRDAKHLRPEDDLLRDMGDNAWSRMLRTSVSQRPALHGQGNAFYTSLIGRLSEARLAVIAEVKRVSPAIGRIVADVDVEHQVTRYTLSGAAAISVLAEPRFWGGSIDDVRMARAATHLPILFKDVIVDEYQIVEARAAGADAVLLIAEVLTDEELRRFQARATALQMGCLVEAHEAVAFGRAVASDAFVVGVNARNLRHPEEIDIGRARQLHTFAKPHQVLVAESGIRSADDARLLPARVDAVLIGTALMRAEDPDPMMRELVTIRRPTREHGYVIPERLRIRR
jgi:indole-3-glycerol phosphate synthase